MLPDNLDVEFCPSCSGTGRIKIPDEVFDTAVCPDCDGTGIYYIWPVIGFPPLIIPLLHAC